MSVTRPSSSYYPIKETSGQGGIIVWDDGRSISAESIEAALASGMKHFCDKDREGEYFMLCSKEPFTSEVANRYMDLWETENGEAAHASMELKFHAPSDMDQQAYLGILQADDLLAPNAVLDGKTVDVIYSKKQKSISFITDDGIWQYKGNKHKDLFEKISAKSKFGSEEIDKMGFKYSSYHAEKTGPDLTM